jgi:hypothetical protein
MAVIVLCGLVLFDPGFAFVGGEGRNLVPRLAAGPLAVVLVLSVLLAASPFLAGLSGPLGKFARDVHGRRKAGAALIGVVILATVVVLVAFDGDHADALVASLLIVVPSMLSLSDTVSRRVFETSVWAAATSFVICLAFTRLPPPDEPPFALTAALPQRAVSPTALTSRLDITFHGCDQSPTVTVNVRAAGLHSRPLSGELLFAAGDPTHPDWTAKTPTGTAARVSSGRLVHLVTRGVDGCYLRLPQLVGDDADRLGRSVQTADTVPVTSAKVTVSTDDEAQLAVVRGAAADQQGVPSRWTCTRGRPTDGQERPLGCSGLLAITEPYHAALQTVLALIIGILFSTTVESGRRRRASSRREGDEPPAEASAPSSAPGRGPRSQE